MGLNEKIKKYNKLRKDLDELKSSINLLSVFFPPLLGNVIATLMTSFEGTEYALFREDSNRFGTKLTIKPVRKNFDKYPIYNLKAFKIDDYEKSNNYFTEEYSICYMPPYGFRDNKNEKNIEYIQDFIDYLFNKRSKQNAYQVTSEYIMDTLNEFLKEKKEEIKKIKEETNKPLIVNLIDYKDECLIERKSLFKAIRYIVNNYEDDYKVSEELSESRNEIDNEEVIDYKDNLIIEDIVNLKKMEIACAYKRIISSNNKSKQEKFGEFINFYEFKNTIKFLLDNSETLSLFMNELEKLYNDKKRIEREDVEFLLSDYMSDYNELILN